MPDNDADADTDSTPGSAAATAPPARARQRSRLRWSWRRTFIVIVMAAAAIWMLVQLGLDQETFMPLAYALMGVGAVLFLVQMYARMQFRNFVWAHRLARAKRYAEAEELLNQFLARLKEKPSIVRWQALATGSPGVPIEAITHFLLGVCRFETDKPDEAQQAFETAVKIAPNFAEALYNCAITAAKRDDTEDAMRWLARTLPHRTPQLAERATKAPELESCRDEPAYRAFVETDDDST